MGPNELCEAFDITFDIHAVQNASIFVNFHWILSFPVIIYTVEIYTGDGPGSDTDTKPYIKLNGTRGDCGQRVLVPEKEVSGNEELFEIGQVDIFQVEAVSLDELTSVTLGHNESAKGQCLAIIHFLIYLP